MFTSAMPRATATRQACRRAGSWWWAPDLPENMQYADGRAAGFRRAVDSYIARTGIVAAPPDADPAEDPLPAPPDAPLTLDIQAERITSVVWCTGFGPDTAWVNVPVLRADGVPVHNRGITASPGLYVAGYPWLSSRGSGLLYGVTADAARIAQHIAAALSKGTDTWTLQRPLCTLR